MLSTLKTLRLAPGIAIALAIAAIATALGQLLPLIGAPVIAIVLGILLRGRCGPTALMAPGLRFTGHTILQTAIVIAGLVCLSARYSALVSRLFPSHLLRSPLHLL